MLFSSSELRHIPFPENGDFLSLKYINHPFIMLITGQKNVVSLNEMLHWSGSKMGTEPQKKAEKSFVFSN